MKKQRKQDSGLRVNANIRCREVFVIGEDGEQLGTMSPEEGIQLATEADLDLVEVSPNAKPPVCRIMDYGKYLYDEKKKAKKGQRLDIKEIRCRPKTGQHDIDVKVKRARRFLRKGHKVQLTMLLRGREKAHPDRAKSVLMGIAELLMEIAKVEMEPRLNHNRLSMLFAPDKNAIARLDAAQKKEAELDEDDDEDDELDDDSMMTEAEEAEETDAEAQEQEVEEQEEAATSGAE